MPQQSSSRTEGPIENDILSSKEHPINKKKKGGEGSGPSGVIDLLKAAFEPVNSITHYKNIME